MGTTLTPEEQKAFFLLMGIPGQGVDPGDEASLKRAFRNKAKTYHPDMAGRLGKDPKRMTLHFQALNDAFSILMDRIHREEAPRPCKPGNKKGGVKDNVFRSTAGRKKTNTRRSFSGGKGTHRAGYAGGHSAYSRPRNAGTGKKRSPRAKEKFRAKKGEFPRKRVHAREKDFFYTGSPPGRNLRFVEYLYYSGAISWRDLVNALVWQYRNRPKLGKMATQTGLLSFDDTLEIIKRKKPGELFGETAVRLGYMNRKSLDSLVRKQRKLGLPIGKYFVSSKKMSRETLYAKLIENRRHNILFKDRPNP